MISPSKFSFPCCWAIFPLPVHAIKASDITWETPSLTHMQQTGYVDRRRSPLILRPKNLNHGRAKPSHTFQDSRGTHTHCFVYRISGGSVSQHPECSRTFLVRTKTILFRRVHPLYEVVVV